QDLVPIWNSFHLQILPVDGRPLYYTAAREISSGPAFADPGRIGYFAKAASTNHLLPKISTQALNMPAQHGANGAKCKWDACYDCQNGRAILPDRVCKSDNRTPQQTKTSDIQPFTALFALRVD